MNNKGKNGTDLRGNEVAICWVFYPVAHSDFH